MLLSILGLTAFGSPGTEKIAEILKNGDSEFSCNVLNSPADLNDFTHKIAQVVCENESFEIRSILVSVSAFFIGILCSFGIITNFVQTNPENQKKAETPPPPQILAVVENVITSEIAESADLPSLVFLSVSQEATFDLLPIIKEVVELDLQTENGKTEGLGNFVPADQLHLSEFVGDYFEHGDDSQISTTTFSEGAQREPTRAIRDVNKTERGEITSEQKN